MKPPHSEYRAGAALIGAIREFWPLMLAFVLVVAAMTVAALAGWI